jgi:hypothetical protein
MAPSFAALRLVCACLRGVERVAMTERVWPHRGSLSRVGSLVMSSERKRPGGSKRSRGALDGEWGN